MDIRELIEKILPKKSELEAKMSDPNFASDMNKMKEIGREYRRLTDLEKAFLSLEKCRAEVEDLRGMLEDPELGEIASSEIEGAELRLSKQESLVWRLIVPENPEDSRNVVLEIRAGTGGDEAALFAGVLYKIYEKYCEIKKWKMAIISGHFSDLGGVKEVVLEVIGSGAYGTLKYESGVHRVQRVPTTEASGRLHTSAATVAVLPEAEEVDIEINPNDLRIDTFRSSGPGGQHVNKTDSAIRITHLPTGIVVSCQEEKSQHKNKAQSMRMLRAKLYQAAIEEEENKRAAQRRGQVSTGDRSAKIRTFNYPQNRVTDHRVPVSVYRLEEILAGDMDWILDPVIEHFNKENLMHVFETIKS